jgi:hypothetical protein
MTIFLTRRPASKYVSQDRLERDDFSSNLIPLYLLV